MVGVREGRVEGASERLWCPPLWAVLASVVVGVWVTLDLILDGPLHRFDIAVAERIEPLGIRDDPILGFVAWLLSQTGGRAVVLVVVGALAAYIVRNRGTWQPFVRVLVALVLLTATVYAFKYGLGRTAPRHPDGSELFAGGQSYPSGHTVNAVLWWGLAVWLSREYRLPAWVVRVFTVLAVAAPIVSSLAMLVLNYHWVTDLIMGVAVGVVLLRVLHLIFSTRLGSLGGGRPGHAWRREPTARGRTR